MKDMINILCFGDSNTFGTNPTGGRWSREIRWTGRLQTLLGSNYYVIEEGLGGRTTLFEDSFEPHRSGLTALPYSMLSHKPLDLVILSLGTNDTKTYFNLTPRLIAKGMETLVNYINNFSYGDSHYSIPRVLIISPILVGDKVTTSRFAGFDETSREKTEMLFKEYEKVAKATNSYLLDAKIWAQPSLTDQLHMEEEDHLRLAEAIFRKIKDIFIE